MTGIFFTIKDIPRIAVVQAIRFMITVATQAVAGVDRLDNILIKIHRRLLLFRARPTGTFELLAICYGRAWIMPVSAIRYTFAVTAYAVIGCL